MSSTNKTPNYDLPQWVASDPVEMADFNQAMSDIDSNLNLGNWITPTLGTGWAHLSGNPLQYRKNGQGKVEFRGGVDITGSPDSSTIFTLGSGLRPAADYGFVVRCIGNNSLTGIMFVASSGAFGLLNRSALASGSGTAVYCNQIQFWT